MRGSGLTWGSTSAAMVPNADACPEIARIGETERFLQCPPEPDLVATAARDRSRLGGPRVRSPKEADMTMVSEMRASAVRSTVGPPGVSAEEAAKSGRVPSAGRARCVRGRSSTSSSPSRRSRRTPDPSRRSVICRGRGRQVSRRPCVSRLTTSVVLAGSASDRRRRPAPPRPERRTGDDRADEAPSVRPREELGGRLLVGHVAPLRRAEDGDDATIAMPTQATTDAARRRKSPIEAIEMPEPVAERVAGPGARGSPPRPRAAAARRRCRGSARTARR